VSSSTKGHPQRCGRLALAVPGENDKQTLAHTSLPDFPQILETPLKIKKRADDARFSGILLNASPQILVLIDSEVRTRMMLGPMVLKRKTIQPGRYSVVVVSLFFSVVSVFTVSVFWVAQVL